jgi:hypothetical protein
MLSDLFSSNLESPWICELTNNQSTKPSFIYLISETITLKHWVIWFQDISWSQNVNWRLLQWLLEYVKCHFSKEHKILPWFWGVRYIFANKDEMEGTIDLEATIFFNIMTFFCFFIFITCTCFAFFSIISLNPL